MCASLGQRLIPLKANPPTIAQDTYAAPASEAPFALTGFAAVVRFALPTLMPACFRYELQPVTGTTIECGAAVPLYGQSGGGVEVKFTSLTKNRCPIANPASCAIDMHGSTEALEPKKQKTRGETRHAKYANRRNPPRVTVSEPSQPVSASCLAGLLSDVFRHVSRPSASR